MKLILLFCSSMMILSAAFSCTLFGVAPVNSTANVQVAENKDFPTSVLQAAANASQAWLSLLDRNLYAESWSTLSSLTKLTIRKDEWVEILEKTRRPLGGVGSRQVVDERTAKDPGGMPKGDYIVMFYKTQFSRKAGFELVTLYLEDGKWVVSTYQVDGQ